MLAFSLPFIHHDEPRNIKNRYCKCLYDLEHASLFHICMQLLHLGAPKLHMYVGPGAL